MKRRDANSNETIFNICVEVYIGTNQRAHMQPILRCSRKKDNREKDKDRKNKNETSELARPTFDPHSLSLSVSLALAYRSLANFNTQKTRGITRYSPNDSKRGRTSERANRRVRERERESERDGERRGLDQYHLRASKNKAFSAALHPRQMPRGC